MITNTLHIITSLNIGGAESMLHRLIKFKPELIDSTIVVSLTDDGKIGLMLKDMGVTVISLEMHNWFSILSVIFKLKKIIQKEKPKIIHTWMYHANLLGGIAALMANNKNIIWSIRRSNLKYSESISTFFVMKIGALLSNIIPRKIVSVAESGVKNHEKYGYKKNKMIVIPNGFDLIKLKRDLLQRKIIRRKLDIFDDQLIIGSVGRFHDSKDYESLVASAPAVIRKFKNIKYMLIGRDIDSKNFTLMNWIAKTGYSSHFLLLGEINDVAKYMSAMDIFCLSSITEGFPNVVGEAMSMALPCVVTDVGDIKKLVGDTAIIVEPSNKQMLSQGLCEMLSHNTVKRNKIGLKGRQKVEGEFPLSLICKKYYDLYASMS